MEGVDHKQLKHVVPGFKCTIGHIYPDVWHQNDVPICTAVAATHMVTMIYRRYHSKYRDLVLSPQELVNHRCKTLIEARQYLTEMGYGLYDIRKQQFTRMRINSTEQVTAKKYRIGGLALYTDADEIVKVLVKNFNGNGTEYPILAKCNMYGFSRKESAYATMRNPYIRKTDVMVGQDPNPHIVLITGIYIVEVNPLKIHVQFKNSYGVEWGTNGFTWVTSDFFTSIGVPSMSSYDPEGPKAESHNHLDSRSVFETEMECGAIEFVQRSVSIATQKTKELVLKWQDYALESGESRIHRLMVATLAAGCLAHVTCKEPLCGSISSQLRNNLQALILNVETELLELEVQLVSVTNNDNLDLGCALIEQAATEKTVQTIDTELAPPLSERRKHRVDTSLYTQGHDFVRLPWQNQSSQSSNAGPLGPPTSAGSVSDQMNPDIFSSGVNVAHSLDAEDMESNSVKLLSGSSVHGSTSGAEPLPSDWIISTTTAEHSLTTKEAVDKYHFISEELEGLIAKDAKEAESQEAIIGVILRCISRDEAALAVALKVFQGLYENAAKASHVGAHLAMLTAIRDVSKLVLNQLTSWVMYSDEDKKFNKDIAIGLIRRELMNLDGYNNHMAKLLDTGKNKVASDDESSI